MDGKSFTTGVRNEFSPWDYAIFALILGFSLGIGVFYAIKDRKKKSTKDFLLAGGNMNLFPVAMSLLASFMSAITLLGTPAEMYTYGTMYSWIFFSYLIAVAGSAHIYIPIFYRLQVTSAYEYLSRRFSGSVRTAASLTFCVQMLLYMAIVLYAPSLALNAVTGFSLWGAVVSVGLVCTFYTTIGGMKAVLWADTFQVGMMFAGLFAVFIKGCIDLGGMEAAFKVSADSHRVILDDFNPDMSVRHTFWSLIIGGGFMWLGVYGTNQAQVQRAVTCPTLFKAKLALWVNLPGLWVITVLCCLIGVLLYAFYSECDPESFGLIFASDQLLPLFVMEILGGYPGIPGLFVACLFSGALSTISSGLNSMAAVVLEDIVKGYMFKNMSDERGTLVSKGLAFFFGLVCLGLSYVASLLGGVLGAALSLYGMITGPLLGLFSLGMFCPWANTTGALVALASSLMFNFWMGVGAQIYKPAIRPIPPGISVAGCNWTLTDRFNASVDDYDSFIWNMTSTRPTVSDQEDDIFGLYKVSYLWYSFIAVIWSLIVGSIASLLTGRTKSDEVDPRLICPIFDIVFPFLPEVIRRPLRFGVDHSKDYVSPEKKAEMMLNEKPLLKTSRESDATESSLKYRGDNIRSLNTPIIIGENYKV